MTNQPPPVHVDDSFSGLHIMLFWMVIFAVFFAWLFVKINKRGDE